MRKRNKLYTVNSHNQALFRNNNILAGGGPYGIWNTQPLWEGAYGPSQNNTFLQYPLSLGTMNTSPSAILPKSDNNFLSTQLSKAPTAAPVNKGYGLFNSDSMKTIGGIAANAVPDKIYDTLDPTYYLADGRESTLGNGLSGIGKGLFKAGATSGNGYLMLAGAGAKVLGSLTNAAIGTKWNKDNIARIENNSSNIRSAANSLGQSSSTDDLINRWNNVGNGIAFSKSDIGKDGWFTNKVKGKYNKLNNMQGSALSYARHGLETGIDNVSKIQSDNALQNYAAFGGLLDTDNHMGAIEYNFMSDYLAAKNKQAEKNGRIAGGFSPNAFNAGGTLFANGGGIHIKPSHEGRLTELKKRTGKTEAELYRTGDAHTKKMITFARNARKWHSLGGPLEDNGILFALGGDIQTKGADFTTDLTHVNAGGTHEENPNEGVQMGIDPQGNPNLVEENETVYNDYVFSNRIYADEDTLKKFHQSPKEKITYSDLSKKIEKSMIAEHENDPISKAGFNKKMEELANAQEEQKAKMQSDEAMAEFASLSPEEQAALLQQLNTDYQGQQEQQENPQEVQEEQPMEVPQEEAQPQEPVEQPMEQPIEEAVSNPSQEEMAFGGYINKFDNGGWKETLSKLTNRLSNVAWNRWANKLGIKDFDWDKINDLSQLRKYSTLMDDIRKSNPEIMDAIDKGYDFGKFVPSGSKYDLKGFSKVLDSYLKSKKQGNTTNNYSIDSTFLRDRFGDKYKDLKELESSPEYSAYTKDLISLANRLKGVKWKNSNTYKDFVTADGKPISEEDYNLLNTLIRTVNGTSKAKDGKPIPLFNIDKDGYSSFRNDAANYIDKELRDDQLGGIFHLTPQLVNRGNKVTNLIWDNASKSYVPMTVSPASDWKPVSQYEWNDPSNHNLVRYFREPTEKAAETPTQEDKEYRPILRNENLRYAGLLGPAVGLGMMAAGVGKPDYSRLDAVANSTNNVATASYQPIPSELRYTPFDMWSNANRNAASARASERALQNNAGPLGTQMAGIVANANNEIQNNGLLYRQGQEYNDNLERQTAAYRAGINQFNSGQFGETSRYNANALNANRQISAQLGMQAAQQRLANDAAWNSNLYGNVNSLFKGLSDLGRENATHNMIAKMAADGLFDTITDNQWIAKDYLTSKKNITKNGGKINRKKGGLTY